MCASLNPLTAPPRSSHCCGSDLRPEMMEAYGQKQMITPNLDKLAQTSMVFNRAYAAPLQLSSVILSVTHTSCWGFIAHSASCPLHEIGEGPCCTACLSFLHMRGWMHRIQRYYYVHLHSTSCLCILLIFFSDPCHGALAHKMSSIERLRRTI